jgi:hypothetical protein
MQFEAAERYVFGFEGWGSGDVDETDYLAGKVDGRSARHQPVEEGGMNENPRPTKRRRQASEKEPTIANVINKPLVQDHAQRPVALPQTASVDMDSLLQAEIADENTNGLLSYVHDVEKKQKKHHNLPNAFQDRLPRYQEPPKDHHVMPGNSAFTAVNGIASSLSAGSQVQQKVWPPMASKEIRVGAPVQSPKDGERQPPFIDTLPKSKQRQIFGLISGIQGGIDHLQKQLRTLQASLGIEVELKEEKAV